MLTFPDKGHANSQILSDPLSFLSRNRADLLLLSSKKDAIEFFLQSDDTAPPNSTKIGGRKKNPSTVNVPANIQDAISRFMAGLMIIGNVGEGDVKGGYNSDMSAGTEPVALNLSESQREWVAETSLIKHLERIETLHTLVASLQSFSQVSPVAEDQTYLRFADYYDKAFSTSHDNLALFIEIGRNKGIQGLETQLKEFWNSPQTDLEPDISDSAKILYGQYYLATRMVPRFRDAVIDHRLALKTQALELILAQIPIISQWQKQERDTNTIARLCGSWLWTVHNHQNHQDHKMTVQFFPPGQPAPPNQPTPATIAIHGDTVYLEWIFPQGRQEDSLLLSNRDTILEGTFKNSLGPYGSISGKRLTTCRS